MAHEWQFHNPVFESNSFNPWWMSASPWSTNRRFAYDLARFMQPDIVVELGVHTGCSLFTFAQAAKDSALDMHMYGIDTWQGDEQAGHYGDDVLRGVRQIQQSIFPDQHITLFQKTFAEALHEFRDGSIDLLHIDGLHTYEAVSTDFTTWLPKLKPGGIVLFHDITGRASEHSYGSVRFWNEITQQYPSLQLNHNWGLGILFPKGDEQLRALTANGLPHFLKAYEAIAMAELAQWWDEREKIGQQDYAAALTASAPAAVMVEEPKPQEDSIVDRRAVAVIMRTKNRPVLLERALMSVASQTFTDYVLVIINDGGDVRVVDELVERKRPILQGSVEVIHNEVSLGMEAASNKAIRSADSTFIAIHDDDDSWHPEFLQTIIGYLRATGEKGAITGTIKVVERIESQQIFIDHYEPYPPQEAYISLHDLAEENLFAPIAFVYARECLDTVGYYNESLPVLGDWDFNIRFSGYFNIAVIPEALAYYHHRPSAVVGTYGNSVIAGQKSHAHYTKLLQNQWLRDDLANQRLGLSLIFNVGRSRRDRQHFVPPVTPPPPPAASRRRSLPARVVRTAGRRTIGPLKRRIRDSVILVEQLHG